MKNAFFFLRLCHSDMLQTLQTLLGETWGRGTPAGEQQWEVVLSKGKHSHVDQV